MEYAAITHPGTKEELRFAYHQISKSKLRCMPTTCAWLPEKKGLFSVGIPKEEWITIQKKWEEVQRKRPLVMPPPHAKQYVRQEMVCISRGHKKAIHVAV